MGSETSKPEYKGKFGMRAEDLGCFSASDLKKICAFFNRNELTRRGETCPVVAEMLTEDSMHCLSSSSLQKIAKKMKIRASNKADLISQIYNKLDATGPSVQKEVEPILSNGKVPHPIYRWAGERENPNSNLNWIEDDKQLQVSASLFIDSLTGQHNTSAVIGDAPPLTTINPEFSQVLKTLIGTSIDGSLWKITYHPDSPALQFEAKERKEVYSLPKSNHFNCNYDDAGYEYCLCCEDRVKDIQVRSLYEPKNSKWWVEYHSERHQPGKIVRKGIVKTVQKDSRYIVVIETESFTIPVGRVKTVDDAKILSEDTKSNLHKGGVEYDNWILKSISSSDINKIRRDALFALGQTYKIRLNPKPEYQVWVVEKLLQLFQDPNVYPLVEAFKVIIPYSRIIGGIRLASIIVYPEYGREVAGVLIGLIKELFAPYNTEMIGLGIIPRHNIAINPLIFYSGGNGDDKEKLFHNGVLDTYVDVDNNNAFYRGYNLI